MENPQEDQVYYVDDFKDKPDEEIKCHEIKNEPEIIIWRNMNTSLLDHAKSRLFSLLVLAAIFGCTFVLLDLFTNSYLKESFTQDERSINESYSCGKTVTMLEAYESKLKPLKEQTNE